VVVEHQDHALTDRAPERFTTTLVRRESGVDWFEHRDGAGAPWLDTDGGGGDFHGAVHAGTSGHHHGGRRGSAQ